MKKPTLHVDRLHPRNIQSAEIAPTDGYALVVDGLFKTQFAEEKAAKKAATELRSKGQLKWTPEIGPNVKV